MSSPASREQLKNWCLRSLGHPVINVNIDDDQLEDRLDEALQYFQEFHHDGVERWYIKHEITADNITNQYITINENIIGVTRIFSTSAGSNTNNIFDFNYQMRLNEMSNMSTGTLSNYVIAQQYLRTMDMLLVGEIPVRFNRHSDRLYIDWDWAVDAVVGKYIIIEGFMILDPDTYTDVYNDRMFKKLATAHIKRQWGTNMKKFSGLQLPGGNMMNGQQIYNEADQEIKEIEEQIRSAFEEPPQFIVG